MSLPFASRGFRASVAVALSVLFLAACGGGGSDTSPNLPPVGSAGTDFAVDEGATATLDGSASDPQGEAVTVRWEQIAGPAVSLSNNSALQPSFTAPQVNAATELRFRLTVTDAAGLSVSDEITVSVRDIPASNRAPTVDAGLAQSVEEGAAVRLTGSASDEDGRIVGQEWTQTAGPAVTLANADSLTPSFTAPAVDTTTTLSFRLTATDDAGATASDEVNVVVQDVAAPNHVPVADAGPDQNLDEGSEVTLLGSGRDDDGTITSYQWTQTAGPAVTLSSATTAMPSFTAPQVAADSELQFQLVVGDDKGAVSAPDSITVTVRDIPSANQPPVVDAGSDQSVDEGAAVSLQGSATDSDGTVASLAWTQVAGPAVTLTGADSARASFTAPLVDADAELSFRLTATDDDGASASDTVTVRVRALAQPANLPPTANAGLDQSVDEGASVNLVGTGTDSDGTIAGYRWTQTAGPSVTLAGATTANASFTAPAVAADTALEFQLTVTDDDGASASDAVQVTVRDSGAVAEACAVGKLCAGTARRSISPSDAHIAGVPEKRLNGQTVNQQFHLGGFGFGPIEAIGPVNDYISEEAAKRAVHCIGLKPMCDEAEREHTWVRAFYLAQPAADGVGTQTLFITLDAVGAGNVIQQTLISAVAAATGVPAEDVMIGQTHTHAGADLQGLWGGVPQDWIQNTLRTQAVAAAKEAILKAKAARLDFATGTDSAFNNYRRPRATDPDADADPQLSVLQAKDSLGAVLGTLVQYAAHPTAIGTDSGGALGRVPHPDYPLGVEDTLETAFGATAVYYNGPIADASGSGPTTGDDDYQKVHSRGVCLAKSVLTLLDPSKPQACEFSLLKPADVKSVKLAPTLEVRHATVILPVTNPLFAVAAPAGAFNRYYQFTPVQLSQIPGFPADLAAQQNEAPQVALTATTEVSRITIGGAAGGVEIVTIPGEATNTFGQYIRGLAASKNMMLMGLTHNSFGYIIPEEEFSYVDPSGDAGFVAPGTGYEEFVSLGPLTAPMLRLQGYNPLFDVAEDDPRNLPPSAAACAADPASRACLASQLFYRIDYIQRSYAEQCRANAPAEAAAFCDLLNPSTPISAPCADAGLPPGLCAVFGTGGGTGGNAGGDAALVQPALDALLRGCDILDTSNCLFPFPNDHFTVPASSGNPQAGLAAKAVFGGTGKRINFSPLAMPRNSAGKPIDPEEWNRNDGFSPGALISTYVPGLSLEKTYGLDASQIGVANLGLSLDANSPVLLLEVPQVPEAGTPRKALSWAEIDSNADLLLPNAAPLAGELPFDPIHNPRGGKAALLIRPGKNLEEGRRYVVVLRGLKTAAGDAINAQAGFAGCRDKAVSALPPVAARCEALERDVFPVLDAAGIARDDSLYLAWDFTVASTDNQVGRLRHMRDDAFATLVTTAGTDCTVAQESGCKAPGFTVDKVTENPQQGIARRIEGTLTVPSYLVPADAAPLEDPRLSAALDAFCAGLPAQAPEDLRNGCADFRDAAGILQAGSLPPNRLNYTPAAADPCADLDPQQIPTSGCLNQARYGDGLPDQNGTMSTRYICQIPASATPDNPARAGVYGHGLLDARVAVTYDGVPEFSREHNRLFCAVDFYGFATGDLVNVAAALLDLSNFPTIPDASQQGMVNFAFLARLLRDPQGFASNVAFQKDGKPVFDRSAVFYDGNSQGGILGGVVMATSKDIERGALGSLGMNYSTLLTRSTDFDEYALPLYASYTDPLDRQLAFGLIQMIWDRSENNGYAAHLSDNSAMGGAPRIAKLDPQFGDHQVTMWSAEVMARTMGVPVDASMTARVAGQLGQTKRHPDVVPYLGLGRLDYGNASQAAGAAMVVWDDKNTLIPPFGNNPPRAGRDPHDDSAKKVSGRCQKAHFLRTGGQLIDISAVEFDGANCPTVPPAGPGAADTDGDGVPDRNDRCANSPAGVPVDPANGCTAEQAGADDDGDGVPNLNDNCANTPANDDTNANGCGATQRDGDGDGIPDSADACPTTPPGSTVGESGCPVSDNASCEAKQNLAGGRSYQVLIPSESGEQISFQVLEPTAFDCAQRAAGAHPLVLHGHGFGGSRSTTGFKDYRDAGFAVISIDMRGFGGSTGTIRVMDPDVEGKDLSAVLDWAEKNLDYLAWRDESQLTKPFAARPANATSVAGGVNLLAGAIGSSYGGGYQLLLQNVDAKNRLDAMAPDITWHDLRWSLNPGDVIKTGWDLLLVAGGEAGSYGPGLQNGEPPTQRGLDPYIVETLAKASATGELPREALEWFRYHSPTYWCGLNGQPTMPYGLGEPLADPNVLLTGLLQDAPGGNTRTGQPGIPVLLSQGMRDTLFNFNDAWWNYQCLAARGDDVRLITHQSGHILNGFVNAPIPQINFGNTGGNNDCGTRKRGDATLQWFREKLKGEDAAQILRGTEDSLCVSLADGDAVDIPAAKFLAPRAPATQIQGVPALESEWFAANASASNVPQGVVAQQLHLALADRPGIVPLLTVKADSGLLLAGIPQARITVSTPQMANDLACAQGSVPTLRTGCDSIVFVGLGLKKSGAADYVLIDDQVLPVRGLGTHAKLSLVGIAERLAKGDSLALMVLGYSPQYPLSFSRDATIPVVNIEAALQLPLYGVAADGKPDFAADVHAAVDTGGTTPPVAGNGGLPLCAPLLGCASDLPGAGAPLQALIDTLAEASGLSGAGVDTQLLSAAADAVLRGCDILDPANCLFPFPNDHFTVAAAAGSLQSVEQGGSGRRVNFNPLAMPRNVFGKGIDPTEWNRNDGYSPGSMLITYVPGLATVKDAAGKPLGPVKGAVPLTDLRRYADADAPILVIDAETGERQPVWAEIDLNAGQVLPAVADVASPLPKKPALIVRAAKNFREGHRYIAVLRNLKNEGGDTIPAGHGFQVCRDGDATYSKLPPVAERCAQLQSKVFPVLARPDVGVALDDTLYLAWDFTIGSAANEVARLRHMRDDAFQNVLGEPANAPQVGEPGYPAGRAPDFAVTEITENPDGPSGKTVRRIRGTLSIPSYVMPADPAPVDDQSSLQAQLKQIADQCNTLLQGNCGIPGVASGGDAVEIAAGGSLPPNRLFYSPVDNTTPVPDASNVQDPTGLRYGDGLPDRSPGGNLKTVFTCNIPRSAVSGDASMEVAKPEDVKPVRPTLYGHGLLGGHGEGNGQASDFGNRYGFMTCAMDWFGFASGDLANVASVLVDLSNFPVIPDGSQQGMLNQMFLARLAVHPDGFAAHPAFQVQGRPVFDRREVFYHGNSQGGILGGTLVAASKDINRGVLGVLGMNYSTLLSRSTDFATYSIPLYLAYPNDLDRPLNFALMQMLWDRSENNGYAAHITDNTALGGPSNQVLMHPAFGDHQVSTWTADVMARTVGARVDDFRVPASRAPEVDGAEFALIDKLDYRDAQQVTGSALVPYDETWASTNDRRCEGYKTPAPPIGNIPPGANGDDPHECPRRDPQARCQASNFLQRTAAVAAGDTVGHLIDAARVDASLDTADGSGCPAVVITGAPTTGGTYTPPAAGPLDGLLASLGNFGDTISAVLAALMDGDVDTAIALLQGGANEAAEVALAQATAAAGSAANQTLPPPGPNPAPVIKPPQPLKAGIAKGVVRIPVGTPLGGYLRPPVGGEYIPGAEAMAGGDPSVFFNELVDFLPTATDHDGVPLAPLPDELRKLHSPYATWSPPSRGYYDSLVAKAVALNDGTDTVVLVKTDFIGMLDELVQDVAAKVKAETVSAEHPQGIDLHDGLVMSGTHTHDGPGAIGNHSIRYFWLAIDVYQPEAYQRVVNDLAVVVKNALADLQPARIAHTLGREGFEHPRKGHTELNGFRRDLLPSYSREANDEVRRRLGLLRIDRANGEPLAVVMNFAVHGIAFDVENQLFSGDVPAALERSTENLLKVPLAMMVQNTGGNISPRGVDNDNKLQRIESFGELFAPQVKSLYDGIPNGSFATAPDLRTVSQRIVLSRERLGYTAGEYPYAWGAAQCGNDVAVPFVGAGVNDLPGYDQTGLPTKIPQCLPAPPPDPIDLADNGVGENGAFVPQDTRLTAVKIGDLTLLTQPGEPLTEYGVRLLDIAREEGFRREDTFIWGYSQDHVGYILAPERDDWAMGGTEGTTTFWGWRQGQRFLDVNRALLRALRDDSAAPADEFTVKYFYDELIYSKQPGAPVIPSPQPGRLVTEVADIERFQATSFVWEGGDPVVDSPSVVFETEKDGQWQPVRRANGEPIENFFEMHLKYRLVSGAHLWTVEFEAPKDWAAGNYRFRVAGTARQLADAPYEITSAAFAVKPSASLVLSAPVAVNGGTEVTLAYTPRPANYRVIDALVEGNVPAPVRQGRVRFMSGLDVSEDREPDIEVRDGRLVAVYRSTLQGEVSASATDVWGNSSTSGGSEPPVVATTPDYGHGFTGALAEFGAALHHAIVALVSGDPATALDLLQTALAGLGSDLADLIAGDENSLLALLTHLGENLAGGDPQTAVEQAGDDVGAVAGLDTDPATAAQRAGSAARHVEAVVMTGNQLPGWSAPSAVGTPYPYPSGTGLIDQCLSAGAPTEFCNGLLGSLNGTPLDTTVRSAHNGVFFHPAGWKPGDAPAAGGAPVGEIAAYAYVNGAFKEIPVQIDEKYPYFLANSHSDFGVYSGTDEELTYAWDLERWNPADSADGCSAVPPRGTPDPIAGLDDDDELTFMAQDAGSLAPNGALPADVPAGAPGQIVSVADPLDPATTRVVYLYRKPGGSAFAGKSHYVQYVRDANADQWIDRSFFADEDPEKLGTSNTGYGPNLVGSVCHPTQGKKQSNDRFPRDGVTVQTDSYVWKATGRWMVREIGIAKPDGSGNYGADLIDRWKGRAFQQSPDSTISLVGFEDEQVNWEANSSLLGERCGPVRCMREVWGADSGTNVTKTETYYRDAVVSRYHVRVHPIPPDGLYTSWDYNRSAMVPSAEEQKAGVPGGRYFTVLRPQGVPIDGINDDIGQVDSITPVAGYCMTSDGPKPAENGRCPLFLDAADPTFNLPLAFANWEQVSAKGDLGSMVYTFELKGLTSLATPAVVPYYRDDACLDDGTGDDPVQRPYPGEASTDPRVVAGYKDRNGDGVIGCEEKQGVYAAHGIHYFATGDVDNAFLLGKPVNEIDGQQWQFMVPTAKPMNVGEPYANVARVPLKAVAVPVNPTAPAVPVPVPGNGGAQGGLLGFFSQLGGDANTVAASAGQPLTLLGSLGQLAGNALQGLYDLLLGNPDASVLATAAQTGAALANDPASAPVALQNGATALIEGLAAGSRVRAGVAVVDMTPDIGYCAGQYCAGPGPESELLNFLNPAGSGGKDPFLAAKLKEKSVGVQSRLTARAIVVEGSNGRRIALLKSDNYLAQDLLVRRIGQILAQGRSGIRAEDILYHVTHNHSSSYSSTPAVGLALFQDAFDPRFFENQARKLALAIETAAAQMVPAAMGATTVRHSIFKGNIVRPSVADDGTPAGYPLEYNDHGLVVMRFEDLSDPAAPKPLAVWVNWGEHPEGGDGMPMHSADFLAPLERMVQRDLGVPLVFSQADVGSSENSGNKAQLLADDGNVCGEWPEGAAAPTRDDCAPGQGVLRDWNHRNYVASERAVRFLADAVVKGFADIGRGVTSVQVPLSADFPVDTRLAWTPGPLSHPYPSVSNCRSETTFNGDPGVPAAGLPDCARAQDNGLDFIPPELGAAAATIYATARAEGVPIPDHYDAPAFMAVEENLRLKLQAFRLGEVLLASCACEAQSDLVLNFESRADATAQNIYDGFDWLCVAEDLGRLPRDESYAQACAVQRAHYDVREFPTPIPGSLDDAAKLRHLRAQLHNDARGWDAPENVLKASSEPVDPAAILGNFTKEELGAAHGYALPVLVGHAGDYNGYTVSYREYMNRDHYRKALTAYGPHTADYMATRLVRMAGAMKGAPELAPEPQDLAARGDEARQQATAAALGQTSASAYDAWQAALPPDVGPAEVLAQPAGSNTRFASAAFRWRGGSPQADNPRVRVQRDVAGSWQDYADQSGEVQSGVTWPESYDGVAMSYAGQQSWEWRAGFEAYSAFPARLGSTPLGRYRFLVQGCINDGSSDPASLQGRFASLLAALSPDFATPLIEQLLGDGCPGGSQPYQLASEPFEVQPWSGTLENLSASAGSIRFELPAYPRSAESLFAFVSDSGDKRSCDTCSFRPWARRVVAMTAEVEGIGSAVPQCSRIADDRQQCTLALPVRPGARLTVRDADGNRLSGLIP